MQVGIFYYLFIFVIAALNDYVIVASIIVIAIRNSINCAALLLSINEKYSACWIPNENKTNVKQNKYRCWTFSEPFNLDFTGFSVCIYVLRGIAETRTSPQLHKTPQTRESCSREATLPPAAPARRLFTRGAASGGTEVTPALWSRGGHCHKSPNDATLQLCTPKRELEQFFHPPLLAANYINANISGVLLC